MEDPAKFHGHMCPMFALGLRMGKLALEKLGRDRESGVKLVAVVEHKNCIADGIQYICGTTYGKNNLHYKEYGKFAASFYDIVTNKSVRIKVKNDVLKKTLEYGLRGQEIRKLPPADREEESKALFQWGKKIVEELGKMSDEDIFKIEEAPALEAHEEPSLKHVVCEKCGELVLEEYAKVKGKSKLCIPCYSTK